MGQGCCEVDMAEVKVGEIIHLSDVSLPKGVESVALSHGEDHDLSVAAVLAPKGGGADEEEVEAAAESEEAPAGDEPAADAGSEEDSES